MASKWPHSAERSPRRRRSPLARVRSQRTEDKEPGVTKVSNGNSELGWCALPRPSAHSGLIDRSFR